MTPPDNLPPCNLATARAFTEAGRLSGWLHSYLNAGAWANKPLSDGLKLQPRWWVGPLEIPLRELERVCGPEAHMEYQVDAAGWEQDITRLMQGFTALEDLPPLIAH